jgi:hypothetical protein
MASSFASSLAAERGGKRLQAREEIGAHFIGTESWRNWQGIAGIEERGELLHAEITRRDFAEEEEPDNTGPPVSEA